MPAATLGGAEVTIAVVQTILESDGDVTTLSQALISVPSVVPSTGNTHSGSAACIVVPPPGDQTGDLALVHFGEKPTYWDKIVAGDKWSGTSEDLSDNCGYDNVVPLKKASIIVLGKPPSPLTNAPFVLSGRLLQ
jgi:hypothetical protein